MNDAHSDRPLRKGGTNRASGYHDLTTLSRSDFPRTGKSVKSLEKQRKQAFDLQASHRMPEAFQEAGQAGSESAGESRLRLEHMPRVRQVDGKGNAPAVMAEADVHVDRPPIQVNPRGAGSGIHLLAADSNEKGGNLKGGSQVVNGLQAKRAGGIDGTVQLPCDGADTGAGRGHATCAVQDRDTMDMAVGTGKEKVDRSRGRHHGAAGHGGPVVIIAARYRDAMRRAVPAIVTGPGWFGKGNCIHSRNERDPRLSLGGRLEGGLLRGP